MTRSPHHTSDEDLLTAADPEAFGVFYSRHMAGVERYFARRVRRDMAADLTAETFASAFTARRRFRPGVTPAAGWLYTIAARRLIDHQRRGVKEHRALEALAQEVELAQSGTPETPVLAADLGAGLLRHLPREQRQAILLQLVGDLDYGQIALQAEASEASIRQRVSRGLGALREPLRLYREAHALAAEDHAYDWGGGHGRDLRTIRARDSLDCSASASLIVQRAGLFDSHEAWTTQRFASAWGRRGEGRYVTVWASEVHIWIEFKLDSECGERFDPTPARVLAGRDQLPSRPDPALDYVPRHWRGL
ncbi:MAG TPA: RNA polymerase sigma factor [Gaiellales bacterium]|nr:RNA polymerase sigma factor [Gaiellales bacterium]